MTVDFTTVDGTAIAAVDDYVATSGTLRFDPGTTTQTIAVMVMGDLTVEADELFTVELTAASDATISDGSGDATILNDDSAILMIDDVTQSESNEDYVFTISLSNPTDIHVGFDVTTDLNTASEFLLAGETEFQVSVFIPDNNIVEYDGEFDVFLSNLLVPDRSITLGKSQGLGTILDDDTATLSINDVTQLESEVDYVFTISLSNPVDLDIFFDVTTDLDTTTVVMDPLVTETTVTITIEDNNIVEFDGFFEVLLSNLDADVLPVTIEKSTGVGTILDDDFADVVISDVALAEGDDGTTAFVFIILLTNPVAEQIEVDFATSDGTATTADGDYQATSGTLRFDPLVTSQTVTVQVTGETTVENDETFALLLNNLVFAEPLGDAVIIGDDTGDATVLNDDTAEFTISTVNLVEGNNGTTLFEFVVTLSNPLDVPVTVDVNTSDVTAMVSDNDYVALSQTLTFSPGYPLSHTVTVLVNGDATIEGDEEFRVTLSNVDFPQQARSINVSPAAGAVTARILNDDGSIMILDVSLAEGDSGTTDFDFRVILSAPMSEAVTVDFEMVSNTTDADDFNPEETNPLSGSITFAPGETEQIIRINGSGDTTVEFDETFSVLLSNARTDTRTVPILVGTAQGRMLNDDFASISISDVSLAEGDAGTTNLELVITLSSPTEVPVTVDLSTLDGTATTADNDYQAVTGETITFTPGGDLSQTVTILVNGDLTIENDETFTAILSNVVSGDPSHSVAISATQGTAALTILNDDHPTISISDAEIDEGDSGTTSLIYTVTLSKPSIFAVSADFNTVDGTATTADGDYAAQTGGTVEFLAGETEKTIEILLTGDTKLEGDETLSVVLSNSTNATLDVATGSGTILNDDDVTLTIDDISLNEGNSGTTDFVFTITLSDAVQGGLTVDYSTVDGTATIADNEYQSATGTATFVGTAGETQTFTVSVVGELTIENDETFTVALDNVVTDAADASLVSVTGATATATILNDDSGDSSLAGFVYADTNDNGVFDSGEVGIPGVTITLTGTDDTGTITALTVMTASDGSYSFTDLRPGTYELTETQALAFADGQETIGTPGGVTEDDRFSQIVIASGSTGTDNNFGERGLLPTFVSKQLWLGSTPAVPTMLRELNARAEELAGNVDTATSIRDESVPSTASNADATNDNTDQAAAASIVQVVSAADNVADNIVAIDNTSADEPAEPLPLFEAEPESISMAPASILVEAPPTLVPTTTTIAEIENVSDDSLVDVISPVVDAARDSLFDRMEQLFVAETSTTSLQATKLTETQTRTKSRSDVVLDTVMADVDAAETGASETDVTILSNDDEGLSDEELFDLLFGDEEFLDEEESLEWLLEE